MVQIGDGGHGEYREPRRSLVWEWDWLGNMTEWTDDAQQFYERSIGDIQNGQDLASGPSAVGDERPSALYLSSNLDQVGEGGGWVELDYGAGGNVTQLTVHGECSSSGALDCRTTGRPEAVALSCAWSCAAEQHFEYRWDELNRIVEAHRWNRSGPGNPWTHEARQRYRYDGANQRTVKESFDTSVGDSRVALYVYPGDFERRGVTRGSLEYESVTTGYETETQYLVAGARLVWDHTTTLGAGMGELDRNRRLTMGVSDLIHTTAASVDLLSGELLEVSTYYPNGARETLRTNAGAAVPLEPMGFTGKEADEDVGLVYFGERYLLARLGRWASPDPLHVHASGGGEALNSYHYVSGNLLQSRDPLGLRTGAYTSAGTSADGTALEAADMLDADGNVIGYTFREEGTTAHGPAGADSMIESAVSGVVNSYSRAIESAADADLSGDLATSIGERITIAFPGGPLIHDGVQALFDGVQTTAGAVVRLATTDSPTERDVAARDALAGIVQSVSGVLTVLGATRLVVRASVASSSPRSPPPDLPPSTPPPPRPAAALPTGGGGVVLPDGAGATAAEMAASRGGPTAGRPVGAAERAAALESGRLPDGRYRCWRCGETSGNAANMHGGHRNVPRSHGGNLSPENLTCEGAACNLSSGNRGSPTPGMDCRSRGGCGAPYGRSD